MIAKVRLRTDSHNKGEGIFSSVNMFFVLLLLLFFFFFFFPLAAKDLKANFKCGHSLISEPDAI